MQIIEHVIAKQVIKEEGSGKILCKSGDVLGIEGVTPQGFIYVSNRDGDVWCFGQYDRDGNII